jgi:hypothetical protein
MTVIYVIAAFFLGLFCGMICRVLDTRLQRLETVRLYREAKGGKEQCAS